MKRSAQDLRDKKYLERRKIREHIHWLKSFYERNPKTIHELIQFWETKLIKIGLDEA